MTRTICTTHSIDDSNEMDWAMFTYWFVHILEALYYKSTKVGMKLKKAEKSTQKGISRI